MKLVTLKELAELEAKRAAVDTSLVNVGQYVRNCDVGADEAAVLVTDWNDCREHKMGFGVDLPELELVSEYYAACNPAFMARILETIKRQREVISWYSENGGSTDFNYDRGERASSLLREMGDDTR